jgi:hypothetical protein
MKLEINSDVETLENEINKIMNQKEWMQFGESKKWDLSEFKAYNDGYNDEGWEKFNNPYEENTFVWWLYKAGGYDYHTNN